jgi:ribonuclease R
MPKNKPSSSKQNAKSANRSITTFLEEIKSEVAAFFEINHENSFSMKQFYQHFNAQDKKTQLFYSNILDELLEEDRVILVSDGRYAANASANTTLIGRVDHVNKGYAFVVIDGQKDDVWIDTDDLNSAVDGDIVEITLFSDFKAKRRKEGRVEKIISRGRTEMVGTIECWPRHGVVTLDSRRIYEDVFVSEKFLNNAKSGEKVMVKITQWPSRRFRMEGEVTTVLGQAGDHNTEMHAILAEFNLPNQFSEALEAEANGISEIITADEIARRRDFRNILTFTIDPADAKDFDDALSFQVLDNGNYEVGVHIADVSHYIKPGTALEKEAFERATSVYLVDRTVPMLPEKLSNNLCSLRPHEDKLTFAAVFELTSDARIVNEWFGRTVIHSDHRFSYEEAQEVLSPTPDPSPVGRGDRDSISPPSREGDTISLPTGESWGGASTALPILNALALKLRAERFVKGAINFETIEVKFQLDEKGKPVGIYQKIRKDAHKLIEEFMLLANKRVAEFVFQKSKSKNAPNTMIYRIHESPNLEKLNVFASFAGRLGYKMDVSNEKAASASLNKLMADIEGKPEQNALEQLAIRTMAKARYSTDDLGHFGLAFRRYSHFTSPIRRYPDVIAHRLLQHYLDGNPSPTTDWYDTACKHSSEREKLATDAERASIKYKQVEYMSLMEAGQTWEGVITGVSDFGIFVEISATSCEGLIRMNDLKDDFYEFDKDNYRLIGQRSKRFYTFGDAIKVKVKETNIARRSIDLVLAEPDSGRKKSFAKSEPKPRSRRGDEKSKGRRR